jgi:hypothetical protein
MHREFKPGGDTAMSALQKNQSPTGEKATEIFRRQIQALVRPEQQRWFLAIDVKSGQFELDEDDHEAISKLLARLPDAEGFLMRADGSPAYKIRRAG